MTLPKRDKLTLVSNLATMMNAGIPILEAIDSLIKESKGPMRKVLKTLSASLYEGHPLSHGMQKMPGVFDPVTINLIRAAEEAGTLETVLKDLTKEIKKEMAFTDKLKSSLTYPVFVFIIFVGVISFILAFVIPRLGRAFSSFQGELPASTRFLMNASSFLLDYYLFIILGVVVAGVLLTALFKAKRRVMLNALLSLPGLRKLGRQIDLANFTRSMGLLLGAGIPIHEALALSEEVVAKKEIIRMISNMKTKVDAGKPLSEGIADSEKIVPQMMIRIIETAEVSGALETSMLDLAVYFESQVNRTLKAMTTLLEPLMLVVMGLLVGGMMLSVIAPMYNMITKLNA